ncbi:hypothetical protein D3C71_1729050 [compost metagenome]
MHNVNRHGRALEVFEQQRKRPFLHPLCDLIERQARDAEACNSALGRSLVHRGRKSRLQPYRCRLAAISELPLGRWCYSRGGYDDMLRQVFGACRRSTLSQICWRRTEDLAYLANLDSLQ